VHVRDEVGHSVARIIGAQAFQLLGRHEANVWAARRRG
jgi:hypothetical protein